MPFLILCWFNPFFIENVFFLIWKFGLFLMSYLLLLYSSRVNSKFYLFDYYWLFADCDSALNLYNLYFLFSSSSLSLNLAILSFYFSFKISFVTMPNFYALSNLFLFSSYTKFTICFVSKFLSANPPNLCILINFLSLWVNSKILFSYSFFY